MKSVEDKIDKKSDYFINSPTDAITEYFLYPTHLGHFFYQPGYRQHRMHFDSFLLMYVLEGSLTVEFEAKKWPAEKNNFSVYGCFCVPFRTFNYSDLPETVCAGRGACRGYCEGLSCGGHKRGKE